MKVISKKNRFQNIPGKPKVKILTKDKSYNVLVPSSYKRLKDYYFVENDIGEITRHSSSLFKSVQSNRNSKINELLDEI
jgi:hypothetical protein